MLDLLTLAAATTGPAATTAAGAYIGAGLMIGGGAIGAGVGDGLVTSQLVAGLARRRIGGTSPCTGGAVPRRT